MAREGIPYVLVPIALGALVFLFGSWLLSIPFVLVAAFMVFFFRDPHRSIPRDPGIIVAPADGRVTLVRPADGNEHQESLVSIFLSPLDVHINRAPITGEITEIDYKKGKFLMATKEQSRLLNEQNSLTISGVFLTVRCTQIAGVLARRIVCWKRTGERVKCGDRFGMIKFSSRTDLMMPANVEILVREGMRVRGGETIIGRFPV